MNLRSLRARHPRSLLLLGLVVICGACATGEAGGEDDAATVTTDRPTTSVTDLPGFDLVNPLDDAGEVDAGVTTPDVGPADSGPTDAGSPDLGTPDGGPGDVPAADASPRDAGVPAAGGCSAGETLCGAGCIDLQADAENCGRCGTACGAGSACGAGRCATAACMTSASDCNSSAADGCEVVHGAALNTCPLAESLGAFCGDTSCGLLCRSRSLQTVATRSGNRSRWFRGRLNECSSCIAALNGQLTLRVPPGTDYDLYVYSACGRLLGSSVLGVGAVDRFTLTGGGSPGNDSADFWVEVRWFSGATCSPWTLTFEARSNSATSC